MKQQIPNETSGSGALTEGEGRRKVSISACIEMALSRLPTVMGQVVDHLKQAAGLQPGMPAQSAVFQVDVRPVVQQLVNQRESLKRAFAGQMRVLAYGGGGDLGNRPLVRFEDIQLLDGNQLDESIELARVQQELDFVLGEQLSRFHALMSSVMGWISVQPNLNPLRPELFAKAMCDTMTAHVSLREMRGEILAAAAGRMGIGIRQIYREISDYLLSSGVEPAGLVTPTRANVTVPNSAEIPKETTRAVLTLERLRRLFSPDGGGQDALSAQLGSDFLHTMPASVQALQDMRQVEAMIERLESRKKERAAIAGTTAVQSLDARRRQPMDGRQLGQQIGEEVTRMMLDNLTQDDRLLPQVRKALQRLTPVLLELAKSDVRFFSDHKHPARQFLDRVTDRSLAYTDEANEGYARFVESLCTAVAGVIDSTASKPVAFAQELDTLQAEWQKADELQIQLREETARALLHVEQRNMLAQRLLDDWMGRLTDERVPLLVRSFLLGPWAQVVAEYQLSTNRGTNDAKGYESLVDDLIWSTQPNLARRNPSRLVQMIPGMLRTLRSGLQLIAYPPERIEQFFSELIACHESVLQEARVLRERAEAARKAAHREDEPISAFVQLESSQSESADDLLTAAMPLQTPWFADSETNDAGYLEADKIITDEFAGKGSPRQGRGTAHSVESITEGDWIELMLEGEWSRLKLTWSSPHRTLFMFTSTRGLTHSMSRRSMDRLLAAGMIRIVSTGLMLDGALDAVAQTALRNSVDEGREHADPA
jgi:hypothetical protein